MPTRANEELEAFGSIVAGLIEQAKSPPLEPQLPPHLSAFIRHGVRNGDDPRLVASLALELASWWKWQWALELKRRVKAEAQVDKLTRKKPRGRPRELNHSAFKEPGLPGRPRVWTRELKRELYRLVERERVTMMGAGRAKVTDTEALTALARRLRIECGESTAAHLVRADVKYWKPRYSEAKTLFGNPRKKTEK